jgi:glyoxylase-like metal-dependent hydrolase (beta-lactamase superfamily II)
VLELTVGDVRITRVIELEQPLLDPLTFLPDCTEEALDAELSWLAPRYYSPEARLLVLAMQSFLVESGGRRILVDTCIGDCKPRAWPVFHDLRTGWLDRFRQVCDPADVDVVVCTHLHIDHVGWNTTLQDGRWVPTFPNARYLFTAADYEYFAGPRGKTTLSFHGDYFADSVQPIVDAGLAELVAPDHRIDQALALFHTPGHTLGHVGVSVESGGAAAALTGDLVHSPLQCAHPTWSTSSCVDPAQAARSRIDFFEHAVETQLLVVPAHFPSPTACRLHRDGSGYGFRYLGE